LALRLRVSRPKIGIAVAQPAPSGEPARARPLTIVVGPGTLKEGSSRKKKAVSHQRDPKNTANRIRRGMLGRACPATVTSLWRFSSLRIGASFVRFALSTRIRPSPGSGRTGPVWRREHVDASCSRIIAGRGRRRGSGRPLTVRCGHQGGSAFSCRILDQPAFSAHKSGSTMLAN